MKTDTHSHILNEIDDGCRNTLESIEIAKKLAEQGFTDIICTPHYIKNSKYNADNLQKKTAIESVQQKLDSMNIKIRLHEGNELLIDEDIEELIRNKKIKPINKFLLFELPFENEVKNLNIFIQKIKSQNLTPVLAHPERYHFIQNNPKIAYKLHEEGILMQCNYGSINGNYGNKSKKTIKFLLKNNLVAFLGTDVHRPSSSTINNFVKIEKKIQRITGKANYQKIQSNNNNILN